MHSTEEGQPAPIDPLQISPALFDFWPSAPLLEWPDDLREFFFETLMAVVLHEGGAQ